VIYALIMRIFQVILGVGAPSRQFGAGEQAL
jgi:hypothetical protein